MTEEMQLHRTGRDSSVRALRQELGPLEDLRRGMHASSEEWHVLPSHERYALRVAAAIAVLRDPILCLESAAVVWGLPVFGEPNEIHTLHVGRGHSYRRKDVFAHTSSRSRDIVRIRGVRVTSLLETTIDLARVMPLAFAVAVFDRALRMGLLVGDIEGRVQQAVGCRGTQALRRALEMSDVRSESVLESISRVVIHLLGFEAPELQVEFEIDGEIRRVDAWWPSVGVIGEADGKVKYQQDDPSLTSAVLVDERRREKQLQVAAGRVIRWDWSDVVRVTPLERILLAAGVPRPRPAAPNIHAALRNPRSDQPQRPRG
ncbi:hypothetical protein [Microbacterium oryzae]|uniref:DUF559 domain-containing protein n=1 Tax=Microbacterium oryzae TaxID=743009 RepID=A0A6I6E1A3_9MICO|nr:hypothetical protein [Microbacterium oryzae]QGU26507.1 hypothetical protein D7D94_01490 [Microbacterium oryzae]